MVNFGKIVGKQEQYKELKLHQKYKIQKIKMIKKFNLIIVCCYQEGQFDPMNSSSDNKVLLLNFKTGEELSNISFESGQIPQHILYNEHDKSVIIGSNFICENTQNTSCMLHFYSLIDSNGILGLSEIKSIRQNNCTVMDLKSFLYFDDKHYLAIAFNSFV